MYKLLFFIYFNLFSGKIKNPAIKRTIAGPIKGRTNMKEHLPASTGNIHNNKILLKFNSI